MAEIDVNEPKLHELLAEQAESAVLEYIGDCDLAERRDIVELASESARWQLKADGSSSASITTEPQPGGLMNGS